MNPKNCCGYASVTNHPKCVHCNIRYYLSKLFSLNDYTKLSKFRSIKIVHLLYTSSARDQGARKDQHYMEKRNSGLPNLKSILVSCFSEAA
jgi:hypothetical protein